ncbi:Zn-dependent hydrolase [Gallibacterium salpingitidis]|uniref:Allantoate amidohydrolase n=1 Tax=Gallibacterium salpingitidis TaxID=505341 RepID=A0A1A7P0X0_9PAST|nr:Zn-dependent hydrolase [Gallibacterium salpingitidis]OBW95391.1 hypothetical protein QS62_03210 [Gallibacterium salpingitidis]
MLINRSRYWQQLMALGEITDPDKPYTRRSFSPRFLEGRKWLTEQMQNAGLTVSVDAAGNLIGKKQGNKPELGSIVIGSHSDSVPSGGRFDGIAGVIAGLECAQVLQEQGISLDHNLEIIDYLAEEPSEWGISCIGSRGISGKLSEELLRTPHPVTQETLADAVNRMGGDVTNLQKRTDIAASLELHIEQGSVLESEQLNIGIVTGIVGIIRLSILLGGQAAHAGTTPMYLRKDTLVGAAEIVVAAEQIAQDFAKNKNGYFVATCGQVFNQPNASNVVAGETQLVFDIRSDKRELMDEFIVALQSVINQVVQKRGLTLRSFDRLTDTYPTHCDQKLMDSLEAMCQHYQYSYRKMPSGAGHDSAFLSLIAPAAMIFVPSVAGKSHCPEEWTEEADLSKGIEVLLHTLLDLDRHL